MKRLLSLVLAISIMVSLFPAVSANEPVSEAAGIKVKYDLGGMLGKAGTVNGADGFGGEGYRGITRDLTNGFFEYAANKTDGKYSWNADGIEYATYTSANKTGTTRFRGANEKRGGLQLKTGTGNWWALKIYVPAEGVYTPKATYWRYNRAGKTYLDYFLIKDTGEEVSTLLAEENLTPESDGYIGSKRNEDTTIKGAQDYSYDEAFSEGDVYLYEGEYYLVYKPREEEPGSDGNYAFCGSFTLDGGDTNPPVPMYADVKTDSTTVVSGGGVTKPYAEIYLSDGTITRPDDVTLVAETSEYASFNKEFGVILGENIGKAEFSAEVTYGGKLFKDQLTVAVVENISVPGTGEVITYDISERLKAEETVNGKDSFGGLGYAALTYESNNKLWEYAANKTNGTYSWSSDGWKYTTYDDSGHTRFRKGGEDPRGGLQINATADSWFAIKIRVPYTGVYFPAVTYWKYGGRGAGAESYMDYFLIKNDGGEISTLLAEENLTPESDGYVGSKMSVDASLASGQSYVFDEPFDGKVQLNEGEYYLVYKPRNVKGSSNYAFASNFTLDGVNCIKDTYISAKTDIDWDEEVKISVLPVRLDGTAISEYTAKYLSTNENILKVSENGVVKGVGEGTADVEITVDDGKGTITKNVSFTVTDQSGVDSTKINIGEKMYVREKIEVRWRAVMNSGNIVNIPFAENDITITVVDDKDLVSYEDGILTAKEEGSFKLVIETDFRGEKLRIEEKVEIIAYEGKSEPTLYTNEMRRIAYENIKKYDWAKNTQKNAIKAADNVLPNVEAYYAQITGEGLPRGRQVGVRGDDYYVYCRYCHARIGRSLNISYTTRPWKVQCKECKRLFPSNDFESFMKLGLDKQGFFDVGRARQAHHEMLFHRDGSECTCEKPEKANTPAWYIFYGYGNPDGFLYNELYSEIRESNEDPWGELITWNKDKDGNDLGADLGKYTDENGKVLWQGGDMWGVDDGWGYLPGRKYEDGLAERHGYIAFYNNHLWENIYIEIQKIAAAYLYTGDAKYGRAGAILLDRVADVWPSFDMYYFSDKFLNTHGGSGYGAAVGCINDSYVARELIYSIDMLYPILEDSQLIGMLSERAEKMELENDKSGSLKIWENWEKGILLATFDMLRDGRISGNFGQAQGVASLAAIVLDKQPETDEILKWVYATNTGASKSDITGGDIDYTLINRVDRDGMGDEASPRYNASWVTNLNTFASALKMYKGNLGFNPYTNPKFVKMLDPQMNLVLLGTKHPSIGDAGAPAATDFFGGSSAWEDAFVSVENENYKKKLAQYIYKLHGGDLSDLRYGIFAENPEAAEEDVMKYVTEGEQLPSDMLTGYGFAVLRDGESYKSASTGTESNTSRDFWMWFGRTPASHAHRDLLNLGIDAFGLDVAPDLGYPEDTSYTPNRLQWVQATLSHNTVVVNEKDQRQPKGFVSATPLHFDDSGKVKVMDIDADEAYSEVDDYRRTVVMVEASDDVSYGVDFFRVTGGDSHTYSFHSQAEKAYPVSGLDGLTPDPVVQDENGKDIIGSYAGADVPYGQDPNTQDNYDYETFYPRGYTWLKNVRRDKAPEAKFTVEFDVQDYRKILTNGKGIKLRMTQLNNFTADEVAIAGGYMTVKSETKMMPETWDYVLVQRKKNGEEKLDSLFTTVYEPYRDTPYIQGIEEVGAVVKNGEEKPEDMVRALKVSRVSNGKLHTDYIVYATNNKVTYIVDGKFDFAGFVGVYTLNANDAVIYRYINHGSLIGEDSGKVAEYSGTVNAFEKDLAFENYIDVKMKCDDLSDLVNRYIYINNDGVENGAYKIISATDNAEGLAEGCIRLDIGTVTLIRSYVDKNDADRGYVYNIKEGQSFTIPTSFADESVPEFDEVQENISTSASSSVSVTLHATSPIKENPPIITYIGTTLPRGASLNSETGVFTWKPDNSQVGDNHVAITALDSDGRESTVHFTVTVYGSTTGSSSSEKTETPSTDNTDTPAGGGGGGGGGEDAPIDKPDGATNTDETDTSDKTDDDSATQPDVGSGNFDGPNFTDLTNHTWASDAINTLAADGIIKGTSASTFVPASNITRADFASLLVRAFKLESDNTENFVDVSASDYYASELAIARNNGIIDGIGQNKFAPRNSITRQDMMVIVYRALEKLGVGFGVHDEPQYEDFATVSPYAQEAVSALIGAGLVNGKDNLIASTDYTTRAEVAVLIKRILDYVKVGNS